MNKTQERIVGILAQLVVQSGFGGHLEQRLREGIQAEEIKLEEVPVLGPILQDLFPGLPKPPAPQQQAEGAGGAAAGQQPAEGAGGAAAPGPQNTTTDGAGGS